MHIHSIAVHDDICPRRDLPVRPAIGNEAHRGCSVSPASGHPDTSQCLSVSPTSRTRVPSAIVVMHPSEQQPYNGESARLCLAFDIGTSFSSISYCILNPGQVPVIRNVNRCGCTPQRSSGLCL